MSETRSRDPGRISSAAWDPARTPRNAGNGCRGSYVGSTKLLEAEANSGGMQQDIQLQKSSSGIGSPTPKLMSARP